MAEANYAEDRWLFIDRIQEWFLQKDKFWLMVSILSFCAVLVLQIFLILVSQASQGAWRQSEFLVLPLLSLFVAGIFWRSIFQIFLSFAGASMTYGGIFLFHTKEVALQIVAPFVANRLGYGIKHFSVASPDAMAEGYFVVGMFALAFCLAMAIRPGFFKSKDPDDLPYPVWRNNGGQELDVGAGPARVIPLSALLTYEENHLVARYKYVVVIISGTRFLVTPYDWIPEGSELVRDGPTNSFIGVL